MILLLLSVSAISATTIICLERWGVLELYQLHRRMHWPKEICIFCLGFWLSSIQLGLYALFVTSNIFYIALAFASASITKAIYENSQAKRW